MRIIENFLLLTGYLIHALLWLQIAAVPLVAGVVSGFFISGGQTNHPTTVACGTLGLACGILWAEHIRKTVGLAEFLGRTIAQSESEG